MGVPLATFTLWKRDARRAAQAGRHDAALAPRTRVAFARVEVVPASARVLADTLRAGMRLIVRGAAGHEAALDGVDGPTAVRLVALVLGQRRR
jgi:hypothetical protein